MRKPKRLKKGDKVGIFLPSSPVKEPYRTNGLERLKQMGYEVVEVPGIESKVADAEYLARTSEEGFADIQHLLKASDIKALWAARGGYGSNYLLPLLDRLVAPEPKIVIGSSDVSYLLWYLLDRLQMVVFYGPMAFSSLAENRFDLLGLEQVVSGDYDQLRVNGKVLIPGKAKGIVTGGCLSNFVSLLGTPYFPNIDNRILLLEDVGERPYRLDRMFWQLIQNDIFSRINGLILGEFPGCFNDEREKGMFLNRWQEYFHLYQIPVIFDLPFGHSRNIHTLPLGIEMVIDSADFEGVKINEKGVL